MNKLRTTVRFIAGSNQFTEPRMVIWLSGAFFCVPFAGDRKVGPEKIHNGQTVKAAAKKEGG